MEANPYISLQQKLFYGCVSRESVAKRAVPAIAATRLIAGMPATCVGTKLRSPSIFETADIFVDTIVDASGHLPASGQAGSHSLRIWSIWTGTPATGSPFALTTRRMTAPRVSPRKTLCTAPLTTARCHSPALTA